MSRDTLCGISRAGIASSNFSRGQPGGRPACSSSRAPRGELTHALLKLYMKARPLASPADGRYRPIHHADALHWDTIEACVPPRQFSTLVLCGLRASEAFHALGIFPKYTARTSVEAAKGGYSMTVVALRICARLLCRRQGSTLPSPHRKAIRGLSYGCPA